MDVPPPPTHTLSSLRNWTDAQAWDGNPPPGDEDIAFIPKGRTIYLSGSAKLKTLIIQGRLIFVDGLGDVSLEASHVLIHVCAHPPSPFTPPHHSLVS